MLILGVIMRRLSVEFANTLALVALAVAAVLVVSGPAGEVSGFGGAYIVDSFARAMKILTIFGTAVTLVLSHHFMKVEGMACFEYPVLVLLASVGMLMMISANDLHMHLYMGLELQSLTLYVIAAFDRDNARSSEAGLKYFVLGALSSGMLLYGMSLIYGTSGSTNFAAIAAATVGIRDEPRPRCRLGVLHCRAGIQDFRRAFPYVDAGRLRGLADSCDRLFRRRTESCGNGRFYPGDGASRFQRWSATGSRFSSLFRLPRWCLGAFAAIGQSNIKRLLAYSSIGHMGFALVGLAAGGADGVRGVVVYMIIYMIMTLGTFACVVAMRRRDGPVETISDLAGLARHDKFMAFVLAMLMFSLAGIPPLAGFFAKYFVLMAAIKSGLVTLAVIGVIASVVSAYYYLRIVKLIYFDEPVEAFVRAPGEVRLVILLAGLFVVGFVLFAQPIVALAQSAALSLL